MFDDELIYPWLAVAVVNLLVIGAVITTILKIVARQRATQDTCRVRLAQWLKAAGEQPPPAA